MALEAIVKSLDDIPEELTARELFSERNGQFELTGIQGVKTSADVDRLQVALSKERDDHKATKAKYTVWGDLDYEETVQKLDRIPELEAAAKEGGIDEEKMNELVEGRIKTRLAPLERELAQLKTQNGELTEANNGFIQQNKTRKIRDNVGAALVEAKVIDAAREDALFLAERVFEIREDDGEVVTRDGVGVTPGIRAGDWLTELQPKRPHWWPASEGGGAGGSGGGGATGKNPWSRDNWNMTLQGQYVKEHGIEKATKMAQSVGSAIGAITPPAEKK